jgi:hypothetical protein
MQNVLLSVLLALLSTARSRAAVQLEILVLRQQIGVLRLSVPKRLKLTTADRLLSTQGPVAITPKGGITAPAGRYKRGQSKLLVNYLGNFAGRREQLTFLLALASNSAS